MLVLVCNASRASFQDAKPNAMARVGTGPSVYKATATFMVFSVFSLLVFSFFVFSFHFWRIIWMHGGSMLLSLRQVERPRDELARVPCDLAIVFVDAGAFWVLADAICVQCIVLFFFFFQGEISV